MANDNEQDRDNRDNIEFEDDPVLRNRVRQDIRAALEPEGAEFRSRRASIMEQIRAEAASQNGSNSPVAPISFTERAAERQARRGFVVPRWAGVLVASLVILIIAAVALVALSSNNQTTLNSSAPQAVNFAKATATANRAADAVKSGSGTSTQSESANAASGAVQAPAAAAPAPTSQPNFAATTAAATTLASATTAAATTAAATTAAATTAAATTAAATTAAAAASTTAAATTLASATTAAATTAAATTAAAAGGVQPPSTLATSTLKTAIPLPLYSGAVTLTVENGPVRTFLQNQVQSQVADTAGRDSLGLDTTLIGRYNFQASKVSGAKVEDVMSFYQTEASKQGYTVSAALLQNDNQLKGRWLYFSKGNDKFGVLIVEVLDTQAGNSVAGPGKLVKGDTGIFFASSP